MNKVFVPHEQALELKKLGFDEPCFVYIYTGDTGNNVDYIIETKPSLAKNHNLDSLCISKPTFSQAFRFFNEKYGLYHYNIRRDYYISEDGVRSYDDIELECLKKLIEIAKEKKNETK